MSTVLAPRNIPLPATRRQSAAYDAVEHGRLAVPVGVPESIQTMQASLRVTALAREIPMLEENVRRLSAAIDAAQRDGLAVNLYMRPLGPIPRAVITFDEDSDEIRLEERWVAAIGSAARSANRIYLHGHTDDFVASESGTELAIRRAVEVRRLLITLSVEPQRIRLFYRGAGNFVANNSTPEGRAFNRRVEIELRKW